MESFSTIIASTKNRVLNVLTVFVISPNMNVGAFFFKKKKMSLGECLGAGPMIKRRLKMPAKDFKLPDMSAEAFVLNPALEKIYKILWAVDPAILSRLKDQTVINIARINVDYRAKVAGLEAQMKKAEAEALAATSAELAKAAR